VRFATTTPPAPSLPLRPLAVLCAVEPALASFEAARHAAVLAAGGTLDLVAVRLAGDRGADTHLAAARFIAARQGARPGEVRLTRADAVAALLAAAEGYDALVVVDRRDDGTAGRLIDAVVGRAPCSVLVARRLAHGRRLGDAVAYADAARSADVVAAARRADATLLVVPDGDPELAARVARRAPCPVLVARSASVVSRNRCSAARGWRVRAASLASVP
jgi:hypothetical protein